MATSPTIFVHEIYRSLQGETSLSGLPFWFIRLTGCDLRCSYCDTAHAFYGGKRMSITEILGTLETPTRQTPDIRRVLITGGEPLLQTNTPGLVRALSENGFLVSIETHGGRPIEAVKPNARIVLDVKTPGSKVWNPGYERSLMQNLKLLDAQDEVKFVITCFEDYRFAQDFCKTHLGHLDPEQILLSPAARHETAPDPTVGMDPKTLASEMVADALPYRFQIQLHKTLWGQERGV